jgi:AcrR family transcriptional regulator
MPTKTRTRLAPQARRRQIVDVARGLFATHPYAEVTVAAIAREAGVTRALVHHYFGSVGEIYLAVLGELAAEGVEIPGAVEGISRTERVNRNVDALLNLMASNRETWLALAGQSGGIPDAHIREVLDAGREVAVARMIGANSDLISDTQISRIALRAVLAMVESACGQWLRGFATREQVHALISEMFLDAVERTIPKLEARGLPEAKSVA